MEHLKRGVMVGELADAVHGYAAGESPARENLVKSLRAVVAIYPSHIWKEDYLLFPLAGKVLTPEDQRDLMHKFDMVDRELGLNVHEGCDKAAAELERTAPDEQSALVKSATILREAIEQLELAVAS